MMPLSAIHRLPGLELLRKAQIRTKLAAIAGVGILAAVALALAVVVGLASLRARTTDLANIARTLHDLAEVRDIEGDMRVVVTEIAGAETASGFQDSFAEARDLDVEMDKAAAAVRRGLVSARDSVGVADLDQFTSRLATWRTVRDEQIVPAVKNGDLDKAKAALKGPLQTAGDGYSKPLDKPSDRLSADVTSQTRAASGTSAAGRYIMLLMALAGIAGALALAFVVGGAIVRRLEKVSTVLTHLARGDLTGRAEVESADEVGRMAAALDTATETVRRTVAGVADSVNALAAAADELSATNDEMAVSAERTAERAAVVSSAANQINQNVTAAASGAEQMGESIREIANSASEAAKVAAEAMDFADTANTTVTRLGESSEEVTAVAKAITSIASRPTCSR
jgi:methyl-accepting chemotaxis protein